MHLRNAQPGDARSIAIVRVDTWRSTYKGLVPDELLGKLSYEEFAETFEERIKALANDEFLIVAEESPGTIVGFVFGGPERSGNPHYKGEIDAIYVLRDYQRQGIGRSLMSRSIDRLEALGMHSMLIWVLKDNPYRAFYESIGGMIVGGQTIDDFGPKMDVIAYGWDDIREIKLSEREDIQS